MGALALAAAPALAGALMLAGLLPGRGAPAASALPPFAPGEVTTSQADGSVPAHQVTIFGATPEEPGAPGSEETWGVGRLGKNHVLVRYYVHPSVGGSEEGTWTLGPALPSDLRPVEGPLAGEMTPRGTGVLLGEGKPGVVLVRSPGGAFEATAPVPVEGETLAQGVEPLLKSGEALAGSRAPLIAPLEEADGQAGALVVPVSEAQEASVEGQVLHWDGHTWTREPIAVPELSAQDFRVLALGASSPTNAWLLAQLASTHLGKSAYPAGSVALFRRVEASPQQWVWKPVALSAGPGDEEAHPLTVPVQGGEAKPFTVPGTGEPPTVRSQLLTVSSEGVWIDGRRGDVLEPEAASTTLFFKPEGAGGGSVRASFCQHAPEGKPSCSYELPAALPSGYTRSFAWADPGEPFGERVITGLREGVSLRLAGDSFTRVLALGAGAGSGEDPGAQFGAAFSKPTEGWLGQDLLPVHLTERPVASRLAPWPVPFRTPLLALAPEPGVPVGSLASEALAVGLDGAVARYKPGQGWLPESLFGPGERVEREAQLRAVAWPTPTRAYAVGDHGQMWLWRGETGLWEKDPATPPNFRGNLLGVAFDPANPARGYAVGTSEVGLGGVLLRYGKTWTEETNLPPQVQGAAFTSIAFAGSEAIVAYRRQPNPSVQSFEGGLLVNEGSGWHVDEGAAAAIGSGVPRTVAGLPDGGAAVLVEGEVHQVYERESAGSPWQAVPVPPPSNGSSLALFREGGALRTILAAGGSSNVELQAQAPPGFPPDLYEPIGANSAGPETAVVLRQTAAGWSDESHELDPITEPEGGYHAEWDIPYRPDPVAAVLVDPTGTQGWAVGGTINSRALLETGDIERYPSEGAPPTGVSEEAQVALDPEVAPTDVTLAFGGHAECVNPCAARARAGVGPQVWLTSALALAHKLGVRAFLYTGPSVSEASIEGQRRTVPLPFAQELGRTEEILDNASVLGATGVYAVASPQDRDARPENEGSEELFEQAFAGLSPPLGDGPSPPGISPAPAGQPLGAGRQACAAEVGCQAAYYAMDAEADGRRVRVIVLDDSSEVGAAQQAWLAGQLRSAAAEGQPAIVVGDANLNARIAAGQLWAREVAALLVGSPGCGCAASAYFYDSPEEDAVRPLRVGGGEVETYGSGTLGYVHVLSEEKSDFHGASGILLTQVQMAGYTPHANNNRAPVVVRLIPVAGELALEARGGTLLRRSETALFAGLARRPRAGSLGVNGSDESEVDPYIPIPEECVGKECAVGLFPEYTFTSSRTDVGNFVARNLASADPLAVQQNAKGEPEPDPHSGLFCTYNAGTTIVTIRAGGLAASLPVTVQAGSVREPCGTVPLKELPPAQQQVSAAPPTAPAPAPAGAAPAAAPAPVPLPPAPPVPPPAILPVPARPVPAPPPPFFVPAIAPIALVPFVPPPLPPAANPTPPSGTSAVTSPVEAAQKEEEEEEATESVSNQAVAYRAPDHEPSALFVLGFVTLAAFAGASVRRPRRDRRELRVAPATLSAMRAQRRMDPRSRRRG